MARPSILNEALIENFCKWVLISGSIPTAIETTGIGRATYYRWVDKVREGVGSALQVKFVRAVEQAEADKKMSAEYQLEKHFDKNWRALEWWLARKYPGEYGRPRMLPPLDVDGIGEKPEDAEDPEDPDDPPWQIPKRPRRKK
jgi:hypothetical protein